MTESNTSLDNVLKFRALVESDDALQTEVSRHVGDNRWDAAAIVQLGADRGLTFSADDIVEAFTNDDELSDFELEMVAAAVPQTCIGGGV